MEDTKTIKTLMILAGGKGTRFKEYTKKIPKPMIEASGKPLLIHIIDIYKKYGIEKVIILAGYKQEVIIDYFSKICVKKEGLNVFRYEDNIEIEILDTGVDSMTGWRIKKGIESSIEKHFYLTYGDGLGDVNIEELTKLHFKNKTLATLTAVRPPARFGSLDLEQNKVIRFGEKQNTDEGWINGGFFIVSRQIESLIADKQTVFEKYPLEELAKSNNLSAYKHDGFWQPCDTIRELELLEDAINEGKLEG
jgi:glucose-1-phosphate cytidylyltransferase